MIAIYPAVLIAAVIIWRKRARTSHGGWQWFAAWAVAGFLMTFSFLTGFSIGMFLLPLAAAVLLWTAGRAPGRLDAIGFFEGIGVTLLLVALINPDAGRGWLYTGLALGLGAIGSYGAAPRVRA